VGGAASSGVTRTSSGSQASATGSGCSCRLGGNLGRSSSQWSFGVLLLGFAWLGRRLFGRNGQRFVKTMQE